MADVNILFRRGSLFLQEQIIHRIHRRKIKSTLNCAGFCHAVFQLDCSELTPVARVIDYLYLGKYWVGAIF